MSSKSLKIFEFSTYLDVLKAFIEQSKAVRGYHRMLSEAAGCQPSFLSQVVREKTHLTPDQAAGLCVFWGLGDDETDFFLTLVNRDRSGSKHHKMILDRRLSSLRRANREIKTRVEQQNKVKAEFESRYYSDWRWALVHIMTSVKRFQSAEAISTKLNIPIDDIEGRLKSLARAGMVERQGERWTIGENRLHLDHDSPFHVTNQRNFRHFMIDRIGLETIDDLHFAATYGLSKDALSTIREKLLEFIAQTNKEVLKSKEDEVATLTLDLVRI